MSRTVRILLGSGLLVALFCLCGWLASESRADKQAANFDDAVRTQDVAHRPPQPELRGDPVFTDRRLAAERRLADFISQVRDYDDFDALSKGLDDPLETDRDIVFLAQSNTSIPPCPGMEMLSVVVDRRVARMYRMLAAMPVDEAARRASECFDERLVELELMWTDCIQFAKEKEKLIQTYDRRKFHAVCCALFLCSQFCDPGVVIDQVDTWKESMEALHEVMVDEKVANQFDMNFQMYGIPQPLFILNVYLCALQRDQPMTTREIEGLVSLDAELLKETPLVEWDFPHDSGAANEENTLKPLATMENWNFMASSEKPLVLDRTKRELASRSVTAQWDYWKSTVEDELGAIINEAIGFQILPQ